MMNALEKLGWKKTFNKRYRFDLYEKETSRIKVFLDYDIPFVDIYDKDEDKLTRLSWTELLALAEVIKEEEKK